MAPEQRLRENGALAPQHFLEIAHGQRALDHEAASSGKADRFLFCDTDAATLMWSYLLTGTALSELYVLAGACTARYTHTFVCDPSVPVRAGRLAQQ